MNITIPSSFSNPIVLVAPKKTNAITKTDADVSIYFVDIEESSPVAIGDLQSKLTHVDAKMHVRGDATAAMPKQQYAVKLSKKLTSENFLGMEKGGKHWVFNDCGAVDYTLLRNIFAFTQQRSMGQYAPSFKFFELFILPKGTDLTTTSIDATLLQSSYHGLYLNFEKIRFQKSRIDLPYDKKNITSDHAILQLNQESPKYLQLTPNPPLTANVEVYEPKLKDIPSAVQTDFLNWYNSKPDSWAKAFTNIYVKYIVPKKTIPAGSFASIQATTDYTSFAAYFVLNEIAKDPDGYHKSTFMVKNKSVIQAGPLWDKNKSYGNTASCGSYPQGYTNTSGWLYTITGQVPVWWVVLLKDPAFCKAIWEQWSNVVLGVILNSGSAPDWITTFIDTEVAYIKNTGALARDGQKWPNAFNKTTATYDAQVAEFKTYINDRLAWINDNLSAQLKQESGYITTETKALVN